MGVKRELTAKAEKFFLLFAMRSNVFACVACRSKKALPIRDDKR